jgi:cytoskeletal protein RodZ
MPALIYLIYMVVHITIDAYYGLYNMAFVKIWIGIIVTLLLNIMCENNMSFFAWLIIAIPFILMTIIAVFILYTLGLDPATGKAKTSTSAKPSTPTTTTTTATPTTTPTTASNAVTTPIYITSATAPLYTTTTTPAKLTIYSNTAPPSSAPLPSPSPTLSVTNTSFTDIDISPPSIYANPVAVNYHGVLADSLRSMQSNFS